MRLGWAGALDVIVDGKTVWSKHKIGRMPTVDEIMALLPQQS
jgi:hypothetical protein